MKILKGIMVLGWSLYTLGTHAAVFQDVTSQAGFSGLNSSWGASWADLDNDGDLDVITLGHVQPSSGSISQIWTNNGNGTFSDVTVAAGYLHTNGDAHGVVIADLDNDGDQDFYMVKGSNKSKVEHEHDLMINNGDGSFVNVATGDLLAVGHRGRGGYAVDYDVDGDLDLFLTSFHRTSRDYGNMLLRNDGSNIWVDVAPEAGIARDDIKNRTASWADYNDDGYPDLLIMYPCTLFENNKGDGTFTDVTAAAGIVSIDDCSSSAWRDYDRDGDLDVYITSGDGGDTPQSTAGFLYRNNDDGTFTDVTIESNTDKSGDARGIVWGDYDNDGWADLYIVNKTDREYSRLLKNNGDGTFDDVTEGSGAEALVADGSGVDATFVDYNNDGALDLFIANGRANGVGEYLLLENAGNANNWLQVNLEGVNSNRDGHMARVIVVSPSNGSQMQEKNGPTHYMSQDNTPLHFGLGDESSLVLVRVEWPDGTIQTLNDVAINQQLTIAQESDLASPVFTRVSEPAGLDSTLKLNFGNPIWGDMNNDDYIDLLIQNHGRSPSIYLNNQNGTFANKQIVKIFGRAHLDEHADFHGYSFTDFNNDNILDLFITVGAKQGDPEFTKRDLLYQGNGDATFNMVSSELGVENPTGRGRSSCWFDYDGDGDLDFLLKNFGTANAFYLNAGEAGFVDAAANVGLEQFMDGSICSLVDFDNDGLMDILLTSENATDTLLRQLPDGSFSDVTADANLAADDLSRGVAWGDYNNDGFMDLYIARSVPSTFQGTISNFDLNNTLYTNNGDGTFTDSTAVSQLTGNFNTPSAAWADINNDGHLDLLVTNAGETDGSGNHNFVYINNGNGQFVDASVIANLDGEDGLVEHRYTSAAFGDYDNDGFLDVIIDGGSTNLQKGRAELYHNEGNDNNFLKVKLMGLQSNAPGIGSVVKVTANGSTQMRQYTGATSGVRNSQSLQPIHFGVGQEEKISIDVAWPKGSRTTSQLINNVASNQTITLVEGRSIVRGTPLNKNDPGCYLWRNSLGWYLRCVGEASESTQFKGRLIANGEITSLTFQSLESNDIVTVENGTIDFELYSRRGADTISFTTSGDGVTLDIYKDGSYKPGSVRLGKYSVMPAELPLYVSE